MTDEDSRDVRKAILLALGGFLAGAFFVAVLVWNFGNIIGSRAAGRANPADVPAVTERWGTLKDDALPNPENEPALTRGGPVVEPRPDAEQPGSEGSIPTIGVNPTPDLRSRTLGVPVLGVAREDLHNSYSDARGGGRVHEAIDILAARSTPVVAVEDGTIARLFFSKAGGITVYQFDPSEQYVYYYAHLERYADNLKEGDLVHRGQVVGYVGTSGNAPPGTPHLHFAIYRMTDKKRWWEGAPIDPYAVLR